MLISDWSSDVCSSDLCTPKRAYWWPDGLDQPARLWTAPPEVVAPPSDPAPSGPRTKPTSNPPGPWQELADKVAARDDLPGPYLTVIMDDGYPFPFLTDRAVRIDSGFRLTIHRGADRKSTRLNSSH